MNPKSEAVPRSLLEYLAEVPDPRDSNQSHPLSAVLALTTCAMLCGARSLYAAAQWGRDHGGTLIAALGFRRAKSPCVATLHNVFKALDVAAFEAALARWMAQAVPAATTAATGGRLRGLAIDGKSLRGSQGHQLAGVHLLAAFSAQRGVAIAQVRAGHNAGGELPAAQALLAQLELCGLVVTGDALFAQRELCARITQKKAITCSPSKATRAACRKPSPTSLPTTRRRG